MKKPTLILIHGWSQNPNYFNLMKPILEKDYKIVSPIMPGFGEMKITTPYDLNKYADWLNAFILKNKINDPILLGHSFGGSVCVKFLSKYPNKKIKLILVDAAIVRDKYSPKKKIFYSLVSVIKPIISLLKVKNFVLKIMKLDNSDYQNINNPIMKKTFQNIIYSDLIEETRKLKNKTLIIWGGRDITTPLIFGKKINKNIKNSIIKIIPNSGHFPFVDDPIKFISYIKLFST
jgi:2-hydroxy-6-oxonona-2,4-dienedioate hydrolase